MTHTLVTSLRRAGNADFQAEPTVTADGEIELVITLAASATPFSALFSYPIAQIKELIFLSTVAATVQLKDSGGSAIGSAITLAANVPWVWHETLNPAVSLSGLFDSDPATMTITNTSSPVAAGTISVYGLYDATP